MRMHGRRCLESRRRTAPWVVVLVVASAMSLASIGLTIDIAFTLEAHIVAIEAALDTGQE